MKPSLEQVAARLAFSLRQMQLIFSSWILMKLISINSISFVFDELEEELEPKLIS